MGHEVVIVNPRRVRLIAESTLKTDRIDAEILACVTDRPKFPLWIT